MDIKMLDGSCGISELTVQSLENMANRQKRKEFFYRSALRSVLLTLLFIAFGCLFAIYRRECGSPLSLYTAAPFEIRSVLKEFFFVSVIPASCFAVCFSFGGRFCRICDTFFPAVYGTYSGALLFERITGLINGNSLPRTVREFPVIAFILAVIFTYALFCSVCASYGECRRKGGVDHGDANNCFTYFLICETALLVFILLRGCTCAILNVFG